MAAPPRASTLFVVATPIGNLEDISKRALDTLGRCDVVLCEDTRRTVKLMNRYGIKARLISYHKFNEASRTAELIGRMKAEPLAVALVSDAGTPCISDPGARIVGAAAESGIRVEGVCGPSAVSAAVSVSGFECDGFVFCGFLPRKKKALAEKLAQIRRFGQTVAVFYESPKRVRAFSRMLAKEFPGSDACFCADISKLHEKYYRGSIEDVAEALEADPQAELGEYAVVLRTRGHGAAQMQALSHMFELSQAQEQTQPQAQTRQEPPERAQRQMPERGQARAPGAFADSDARAAEAPGAESARNADERGGAVMPASAEPMAPDAFYALGMPLTAEALLLNVMALNSASPKQAIAYILARYGGFSKNQLYKASLNLKTFRA
jgi:16S rRNA (cytidine1402-2'-O)-methyltransferase